MALFDALVSDVAGGSGLGTNAGPLVREVLHIVADSPGGVGGFLDKLKSAGLGSEVASWLGHADAKALSAQQIDRILGSAALGDVAGRLGLGTAAASTAVGYTLPKVIGALTPGGAIPTRLSPEITNFLFAPAAPRVAAPAARVVEQVAPRHIEVIHDEPHMTRWLWPLLGALAVLGLGSYILSGTNRAPVAPVVVEAPVVPPAAPAPALPARLELINDGGVIHYSGSVHDDDSRTAIINSLKAVFGADKIQGDITIDLNRGAAPWLVNFRTALEAFKVPGVRALFDGNSVNIGGDISAAEGDRISSSLRSVLANGMMFGSLTKR